MQMFATITAKSKKREKERKKEPDLDNDAATKQMVADLMKRLKEK
jgi:hypothetical protein